MICLWSGPPGFNCLTSVAPAFQSWFAVEYSSCFISVMNLDLYVRCFDSLLSRDPSHRLNNLYVYMNPRMRLMQRKTGLSPTVIYKKTLMQSIIRR